MVSLSPGSGMRLLRAFQGLLIVAILWSSGGLLRLWHGSGSGTPIAALPVKRSAATHPAEAALPLEGYAPIWQRNWKQPLMDPPPPAPRVEVPKPPSPVRVRLVGTMIEPNARFALLADENRQLKTKAVGERIDQFTIAAIERGKVQLVQGQRKVWLEVPNPGKP